MKLKKVYKTYKMFSKGSLVIVINNFFFLNASLSLSYKVKSKSAECGRLLKPPCNCLICQLNW